MMITARASARMGRWHVKDVQEDNKDILCVHRAFFTSNVLTRSQPQQLAMHQLALIMDLSWLDELAPLQVPDDAPKRKRQRQRTAAPPAASSPLKSTPASRRTAAKDVGAGRSKRSRAPTAPVRSKPSAATSHGQRGAHDQGERQRPDKTEGGQGTLEPRKAKRGSQVREQISDRHFLGALDGSAIVVHGPLPPPPKRADIAEIIVIDSDTSQATDEAGVGAGNQKRGRTRAPPKTKTKQIKTKKAETTKAETKPKPKESKPKTTTKPKADKKVVKTAGKRVLRKTREASPSPLSSPPLSEHAEPVPTHVDRESSELNFVLPAHRLFVGRVLSSPFLFGTEGPWSAENLAWIEGRDLEEVRPKKWEPHFWQ